MCKAGAAGPDGPQWAWDVSWARVSSSAPPPPPFAVVLLNRPLPQEADPLFKRYWGSASLRVAADGGAARLADRRWASDLPLDTVVGDMDSCSASVLDAARARGAEVHHVRDQDTTDMEKSLAFALRSQPDASCILVLGDLGGRVDHTFATIGAMARWAAEGGGPPTVVHSLDHLHVVLPAGRHAVHLGDPHPGPLQAALLPVGAYPCPLRHRSESGPAHPRACPACPATVTTTGFKWDMKEQEMRLGGLVSACNEVPAGTRSVEVTASAPVLLMVGSGR